MLTLLIRKYLIKLSMTSTVIEGHKMPLLCLTLTYVINGQFLSLFLCISIRPKLKSALNLQSRGFVGRFLVEIASTLFP